MKWVVMVNKGKNWVHAEYGFFKTKKEAEARMHEFSKAMPQFEFAVKGER